MNRYAYTPPRPLAAFLVAVAVLHFLLASCASTKQHPVDERHNAELVTHPVPLKDSAGYALVPPLPPAVLPTSPPSPLPQGEGVVKPSLPNRILDGIGLSTPEGRARRQARKDAKAAAPGKTKINVGKGGQYAPNATQAVNGGNKTEAPTTAAGPAAVVSNAAENSQQQNALGDNNDLTADKHDTTQQAKDWKAELASPVGKVVAGIAGLILTAAVVYGFVLWRNKKKTQSLLS